MLVTSADPESTFTVLATSFWLKETIDHGLKTTSRNLKFVFKASEVFTKRSLELNMKFPFESYLSSPFLLSFIKIPSSL
jgi:hypothetical protein